MRTVFLKQTASQRLLGWSQCSKPAAWYALFCSYVTVWYVITVQPSAKSKWCFLGFSVFRYWAPFWELSDLVTRCVRVHAVTVRLSCEALASRFPTAWPGLRPFCSRRQLVFLSSIRRQGRYLGKHEPWFLKQQRLSCGIGTKKEVAPLKPDFCQLVMPANDMRPFNKGAPTIAKHCSCCHAVSQPQTPPCDPAWQECVT